MSYSRIEESKKKADSKPVLNKLSKAEKLALLIAAEKFFENKEYTLALKNYNIYLQHHPYDDLNAFFSKGTTLAALDRYAEAAEIFKLIIKLTKDYKNQDPEVFNNYGAALLHLNKPELALEQFMLAAKLRPDHIYTWHNIGAAYYAMGNPGAALASLDQALFNNGHDEKIIESRDKAVAAVAVSPAARRESISPVGLHMFKSSAVEAPRKELPPHSPFLSYTRLK